MKIYIKQIPATIMNEIYLVQEPHNDFRKGDIIRFINIKENGEVIATEKVHDYGMRLDMKPTMILNEMETRELIAAFADLSQARGIEPNSESLAKGKAWKQPKSTLRICVALYSKKASKGHKSPPHDEHNMNDEPVWIYIAFWILLGMVFLLNAWLYLFAPCKWVGWLPAKDVPARCLTITK